MLYLTIGIIFILVAGAAEGVKDKLNFHYDKSIFSNWNQRFWNPFYSWRNKYIDKDPLKGESFRGKYFVATTDGWHLMKFIDRWCGYLGIFFIIFSFNNQNLLVHLLYAFSVIFIGRSLTFNLVWKLTNK